MEQPHQMKMTHLLEPTQWMLHLRALHHVNRRLMQLRQASKGTKMFPERTVRKLPAYLMEYPIRKVMHYTCDILEACYA